MFDLKTMHSVLEQLEQEKGIPREKVIEAIEMSLASAYKKEYGKKGQIIRVDFDINTGKTDFAQIKTVVDESMIKSEDEDVDEKTKEEEIDKIRFNPEQYIMIEDAKKIKKNIEVEEEIIFPLEPKEDFGRIAAQTAKQTIIQKIREAERTSIFGEFGSKEGDIMSGTVQRIERGNIFVDLGRATGILPYEEQIRNERYKAGDRIRAYLYSVEETPKGIFLRLSRKHPKFLYKLFEIEAPEIASGVVEIKEIAREAGARTKIAVFSNDEHIDPIGSLVGQRGVRVSTIMSELGGEKIDIIEWSDDPKKFIEDSLSPAKIISIETNEEEKTAKVEVSDDQQSLAIGKGGQNVRLAAKLTGWKIDIKGVGGVDLQPKKEKPSDDEKVTDKAPEEDTKTEVTEEKIPEKEVVEEVTLDKEPKEETPAEETSTKEVEEETPTKEDDTPVEEKKEETSTEEAGEGKKEK